jgi:hypothetical protein
MGKTWMSFRDGKVSVKRVKTQPQKIRVSIRVAHSRAAMIQIVVMDQRYKKLVRIKILMNRKISKNGVTSASTSILQFPFVQKMCFSPLKLLVLK